MQSFRRFKTIKPPNTSVYGCVSLGNKLRPRIQIMSADLPRQALVKSWKKLSSMSSSKSCGPQAAFLHQHYDNSWYSMGSRVDPGWSCCRGSIFHHNNWGDERSHEGSPSDRLVGHMGYKVMGYCNHITFKSMALLSVSAREWVDQVVNMICKVTLKEQARTHKRDDFVLRYLG